MNKKTAYQAPQTKKVAISIKHQLMLSSVDVSSSTYDSSTNGAIRSRGNDSFWDDEE